MDKYTSAYNILFKTSKTRSNFFVRERVFSRLFFRGHVAFRHVLSLLCKKKKKAKKLNKRSRRFFLPLYKCKKKKQISNRTKSNHLDIILKIIFTDRFFNYIHCELLLFILFDFFIDSHAITRFFFSILLVFKSYRIVKFVRNKSDIEKKSSRTSHMKTCNFRVPNAKNER